MILGDRRFRGRLFLAQLACVCALGAVLSGCGGLGSKGHRDQDSLAGTQDEQARRLQTQILAAGDRGQDRQIVDLTGTLLDYHSGHAGNGQALALAVPAAQRLGNTKRALELARVFARDFPDSPLLVPALEEAMAAAGADGQALQQYRALLSSRHDAIPGGLPTPAAGGPGTPATAAPAVPLNNTLIGLLAPLTGRFAMLGNAFYEAARLAVEQANSEFGTAFELRVADSAGDPVQAALAARALCLEAGCLAVVGALTSGPTVSAALVTQQYGVPLISPTATNDRIGELGPYVFQTNLTDRSEIQLLARLVVEVLLKKTFAIIAPDTPEGRRQGEDFRREVEGLGGTILTEAYFSPQVTDFRDQILYSREQRPEAVFVPATFDQMVMLGPQLDFYNLGSLVLGLSTWSAAKLVERTGATLERAVFPDELAWFPAAWTAEFQARWDQETYPGEAASVGLWTYQAVRKVTAVAHAAGAGDRDSLNRALAESLAGAGQGLEAAQLDQQAFAAKIRMISEGTIRPFPAELFTGIWATAADSVASAAGDSLPEGVGPGASDLPSDSGIKENPSGVTDSFHR